MHIETDTMSVEKPDTACETDPVSKWAPYGLPQSMQADLLGLANSVHLEEFVSYQLVLLYEIMSDVSNTLYVHMYPFKVNTLKKSYINSLTITDTAV